MFVKKIFRKKKIFKLFLAIFLYLKKNSVDFRKKKIEKKFENKFANFLFLEKKSVNSRLKLG